MADYRFLIAVILVIGLVVLLFRGELEAAGVLMPLVILAVEWYFKAKDKKA